MESDPTTRLAPIAAPTEPTTRVAPRRSGIVKATDSAKAAAVDDRHRSEVAGREPAHQRHEPHEREARPGRSSSCGDEGQEKERQELEVDE